MRPFLPAVVAPFAAAVLAAAAAPVGAADSPGGGLTTEALRARSPLAAALGARVEEPRVIPGLDAPAGSDAPAWRRVLAPRSASGLFTQVFGGGLSTSEFDLRSTHGLRGVPPFVTLSPGLNILLPDGPATADFPAPGPDLNGALWGVSAEFMAFMPLSEKWAAQVAVAPGLYSDFEPGGTRVLGRVPARALGIYTHSPRTQFTVGAVYLARDDVTWVPALGVIHRPTDRTALELILPRPRVVHRFWGPSKADGGFGYVAGELGGGTWGVRRESGRHDAVTLSDLRLLTGLEVKRDGRTGLLAETGWVFNRDIEYESGVGDADFDDAWLFRVGVRK